MKTCGVMQFWFASQTSVAVSLARTCSTVPPFFGTLTVGTHSGAPFGMSFWKNPGRSIPPLKRCIEIGRSRTWGSITGATSR